MKRLQGRGCNRHPRVPLYSQVQQGRELKKVTWSVNMVANIINNDPLMTASGIQLKMTSGSLAHTLDRLAVRRCST